MVKRSFATLLLVGLLLTGAMASAAVATEAEVEHREYEEIVENASDAGLEFIPEEYERPGFFDWIIVPLVGVGVLVTVGILGYYLVAQPRFQRESETRSRR